MEEHFHFGLSICILQPHGDGAGAAAAAVEWLEEFLDLSDCEPREVVESTDSILYIRLLYRMDGLVHRVELLVCPPLARYMRTASHLAVNSLGVIFFLDATDQPCLDHLDEWVAAANRFAPPTGPKPSIVAYHDGTGRSGAGAMERPAGNLREQDIWQKTAQLQLPVVKLQRPRSQPSQPSDLEFESHGVMVLQSFEGLLRYVLHKWVAERLPSPPEPSALLLSDISIGPTVLTDEGYIKALFSSHGIQSDPPAHPPQPHPNPSMPPAPPGTSAYSPPYNAVPTDHGSYPPSHPPPAAAAMAMDGLFASQPWEPGQQS
ncbi:unnamed protein product [Vitrella brassicaformis CCMP3155]|uniref:Uncharacterized protein n=1 Tax=Vitrella brassicaformis (strain CCMP3155) TaxID=1169540 RepID=A0A0G4GT91_VITBC|nr:unnamed protein product [Vitrella brassicaformis CCMP3155]|eukprot:CEM33693.1 unnamed protein product [Vitrella brassicaformis CCMP3155]